MIFFKSSVYQGDIVILKVRVLNKSLKYIKQKFKNLKKKLTALASQ